MLHGIVFYLVTKSKLTHLRIKVFRGNNRNKYFTFYNKVFQELVKSLRKIVLHNQNRCQSAQPYFRDP